MSNVARPFENCSFLLKITFLKPEINNTALILIENYVLPIPFPEFQFEIVLHNTIHIRAMVMLEPMGYGID